MNHAISSRKLFTVLVWLMLPSIAFAQASTGPGASDKAAPKVSYILAGRLFDGTGDNVRENVVIVVEDEKFLLEPIKPPSNLELVCSSIVMVFEVSVKGVFQSANFGHRRTTRDE